MKSKISIWFIFIKLSLFAQNDLLNEAKYWVCFDSFENKLVQLQKKLIQ